MTEFERIAPRLARAHRRELAYQGKLAEQRRRGLLSMDVVAEEMTRGARLLFRSMKTGWEFQRQTLTLQQAAAISHDDLARIRRAVENFSRPHSQV